jgi:hypothetical protein
MRMGHSLKRRVSPLLNNLTASILVVDNIVLVTWGRNGNVPNNSTSSDEIQNTPTGVARPVLLSGKGFALLRRTLGAVSKGEERDISELKLSEF